MSSEAERQRLIPKGDDRTNITAASNSSTTSSSTCYKFGVPIVVVAVIGAVAYILFTVISPMHGQDNNVPPSPSYALVTSLQNGDRLQLYSSSYGKFLNLPSATIDDVKPDRDTDEDAETGTDVDDSTSDGKHSIKKNKDTDTDTSTGKHKHKNKSKTNLRSSSPEDNTQLVLGDSVPFLYGSTFEVVGSTGDCFQLRAMNRKFLSLDKHSGVVTASSDGELSLIS